MASDSSEEFLRVQRAYDSLRTNELRRQQDAAAHTAAMAAVVAKARILDVELSDMEYSEEIDEEDTCGNVGATRGVPMWRYECHCGDDFLLSEEDVAMRIEEVPCRSCSLVLRPRFPLQPQPNEPSA